MTKFKKILYACFAALLLIFLYNLSRNYLTLDFIKQNKENLLLYVNCHYLLSVATYIMIYCIITGLSLPGAALLTITSGFLFGIPLGVAYALIGATTGGTIGFLVTRYLIKKIFRKKIRALF